MAPTNRRTPEGEPCGPQDVTRAKDTADEWDETTASGVRVHTWYVGNPEKVWYTRIEGGPRNEQTLYWDTTAEAQAGHATTVQEVTDGASAADVLKDQALADEVVMTGARRLHDLALAAKAENPGVALFDLTRPTLKAISDLLEQE